MSKCTFAAAFGVAALCLVALSHAQTTSPVQPTGTTGATAFHPAGQGKAEADASTTSATDKAGNAGMQPSTKPGFDNKPPKGVKENCHRPQGGVDASGGENLTATGKHNTSCTGNNSDKAGKPAKG